MLKFEGHKLPITTVGDVRQGPIIAATPKDDKALSDTFVRGASYDLDSLIKTHLFVISVNNSGSTFLRRSFEISPSVWHLEREGQHTAGFQGPFTRGSSDALVWNALPDNRARYLDPSAYDWDASRRAWYFQARARSPEASIFVTSSPPFLLNVPMLAREFVGARFIMLNRHPLAIAEGILRRPIERRLAEGIDRVAFAATHIGRCFSDLRELAERRMPNMLVLGYEDLCADPLLAAQAITEFVPGLSGYTLDQKVPVKGIYHEPLRNMNGDAFARLDPNVRDRLIESLGPFENAFAFFGYSLTNLDPAVG